MRSKEMSDDKRGWDTYTNLIDEHLVQADGTERALDNVGDRSRGKHWVKGQMIRWMNNKKADR